MFLKSLNCIQNKVDGKRITSRKTNIVTAHRKRKLICSSDKDDRLYLTNCHVLSHLVTFLLHRCRNFLQFVVLKSYNLSHAICAICHILYHFSHIHVENFNNLSHCLIQAVKKFANLTVNTFGRMLEDKFEIKSRKKNVCHILRPKSISHILSTADHLCC